MVVAPRHVLGVLARVSLSCLLAASASVKLLDGHTHDLLLSKELYYLAALLEYAAALMLWSRWRGAVVVVLLCGLLSAGVYVMLSGPVEGSRCGCFGSHRLARAEHLALISLMGMLALISTIWSGGRVALGQVHAERQ